MNEHDRHQTPSRQSLIYYQQRPNGWWSKRRLKVITCIMKQERCLKLLEMFNALYNTADNAEGKADLLGDKRFTLYG